MYILLTKCDNAGRVWTRGLDHDSTEKTKQAGLMKDLLHDW